MVMGMIVMAPIVVLVLITTLCVISGFAKSS
jgi:hypothetical protein